MSVGSLPENKHYADAVVLGAKVYVVSGNTPSSVYGNRVYAADLNASLAGVFDLYFRDGNASAGGVAAGGTIPADGVTPELLSSEAVAALKPVIAPATAE